MAHQLRYHRSFKRSLKNLDQQSVGAIYQSLLKFEDNPDFNSCRLERLHHNGMYSIRASKDLRVILAKLEQENENFWLALHANRHDAAYGWAADRRLDYSKETQTFDITYVEGKEISPSDFSTQLPNTCINNLSYEQLRELGVKADLVSRVKLIRRHEDVEELRNYLPSITADALEFIMLKESYAEVLKLVKDGQVDAKENEVGKILDSYNNQQNIVPIKRNDDLDRFFSGDFEEWMVYLHPSQNKLVDKNFSGAVKLTGGAGTGKTVVAMHRAKRLGREPRTSLPLLFTTYSKNLADNLRGQFEALGLEGLRIQLKSFLDLVYQLGSRHKILPARAKLMGWDPDTDEDRLWREIANLAGNDYDWQFLKEEYYEVFLYFDLEEEGDYRVAERRERPRLQAGERQKIFHWISEFRRKTKLKNWVHPGELMNRLARGYQSGEWEKPYSHILVDEVQDFGMAELRLIRSLTAEGENDLFLCGDPKQKTSEKKFSFKKAGINIMGRSYQLRINYRTTEQIRLAAFKVLLGEQFEGFEEENYEFDGYYSLLQGEKPSYRIFSNTRDELDYVLKEILDLREKGMPEKEICVGAFRNAELKEIKKKLHQEGIPYYDLESNEGDREGVRVSSFFGVKGMEFRMVILTGLCEEKLPHRTQGFHLMGEKKLRETIKRQKAALYVSMSRARDRLLLTGTQRASGWIDVGSLVGG